MGEASLHTAIRMTVCQQSQREAVLDTIIKAELQARLAKQWERTAGNETISITVRFVDGEEDASFDVLGREKVVQLLHRILEHRQLLLKAHSHTCAPAYIKPADTGGDADSSSLKDEPRQREIEPDCHTTKSG